MRSFLIQLESWEAALKSGFSDDDSSSSYHALGIAKLLGWVRYPGGRKRRHSTIPRERGLPRGLVEAPLMRKLKCETVSCSSSERRAALMYLCSIRASMPMVGWPLHCGARPRSREKEPRSGFFFW